MSRRASARLARVLRRTALPLASYYAITLVVPLANGAARSGQAFAEHALVVLVVPLLAIAAACVARATLGAAMRLARHGRSAKSGV